MSIATQITRLQNIKTAIRTALVNKGITAASTHDMEDFATDISNIPSGGTYQTKNSVTGCMIIFDSNCYTEQGCDYVDVYYKNSNTYDYVRRQGAFSNWTDVIVPVTDEVYVYWHSDGSVQYWGYKVESILPYTGSSFTTPTATNVNLPSYTPIAKTLSNLPESAHPNANSENYLYQISLSGLTSSMSPDSGYDAMSSATIPAGLEHTHSYPLLQSKSVTPTSSSQTIKPDGAYSGLSQVTVAAGGVTPSGNINLGTFTTNGTRSGYDVTNYATASFTVQVPSPTPSGNVNLGTYSTNGSKSGNVSGYATCSFTVNVTPSITLLFNNTSYKLSTTSLTFSVADGYSYYILVISASTSAPSTSAIATLAGVSGVMGVAIFPKWTGSSKTMGFNMASSKYYTATCTTPSYIGETYDITVSLNANPTTKPYLYIYGMS